MSISEVNLIIKKIESMNINDIIYINNNNPLGNINKWDGECELVIRRFLKDTYIIRIAKASTSGSLGISVSDMSRLTPTQFYFINALMEAKKNNIKYTFHFSDECPILKNFIFDFYSLMVNNNIELSNIIICGCDFYAKSYIHKMNKEWGIPLFSYVLKWDLINHAGIDSITTSNDMFHNNSLKKYKSTSLFGRIDENRVNFIYNLFKIDYFNKDNLYVCFANQENSDFSSENYEYAESILSTKNLDKNYIQTILKTSKVGYHHESEGILTPSLMRFVPENNDSYLWITSESIPTIHEVMFISEKTLKAFLWYKPLVVYSVPNTIKLLKYIGFIDVFELMGFDSSYDLEEDDDIRLNMIVSQISLFIQKSIKEIHELYNRKDIQDALIHNNNLFKKLIGNSDNLHVREGETVTNKTMSVFEEYLKNIISSKNQNTENYNLIDKFDSDVKLFFK